MRITPPVSSLELPVGASKSQPSNAHPQQGGDPVCSLDESPR
jgi:hypothetical protein